jgi:hypothetical protein
MIVVILLLLAYWLPSVVASLRKHPDSIAITVVNLFTGWTLIGWVIALAWAHRGLRKDVQYR